MILVFVRRSPVATAGASTVLSTEDVKGDHSALLAVGVAHLEGELVVVGVGGGRDKSQGKKGPALHTSHRFT